MINTYEKLDNYADIKKIANSNSCVIRNILPTKEDINRIYKAIKSRKKYKANPSINKAV